jgi:ADP-ribosylglycohydrolase
MDKAKQIRGALYAGIIGDTLGVPSHQSLEEETGLISVKNRLGYGRYDEPVGTWSDDTSLTLCTMESLNDGYSLENIGKRFCQWLFEAYWTPYGYVFDAGVTTFLALERIHKDHIPASESGSASEDDNGNGALMRILPAALYFHSLPLDHFLQNIHEITAITHAHPRSLIGCGIYSLIVRKLLNGKSKKTAYNDAVNEALNYYNKDERFKNELKHFLRIVSHEIGTLPQEDIVTSGYIVETLESALWCFLQHSNTSDIITTAVRLGLETDTTGIVAGGLAGACYDLDGVNEEWITTIARKDEIDRLIETFTATVLKMNV